MKWKGGCIMPFTQADRVIYKKNPLEQVLCQFRYTPILSIDSKLPADFQDFIREDFPLYEEIQGFQQDITAGINLQLVDLSINPITNINAMKNYVFMTEDRNWRIDLTRDYISLATKKYERWEDFLKRLQRPLSALCEIYKPSNYTRLGLRYINLFKRSNLDLKSASWKDLIQEPFAGILSSKISEYVKGFDSIIELDLPDDFGKVRISAALVKDINNEICFLLDNDFYIDQKVVISDALKYLNVLNNNSTNLLHYAIKQKLHNAMEPIKP